MNTENDSKKGHTGTPGDQSITIYQHSMVLYWWPVWLVGFVFAALSRLGGEHVDVGGQLMWFHPSLNLGVIYLLVVFCVFVVTNLTVRGLASVLVLMAGIIAVLVCSLFGWWDALFSFEKHLSIHMDLGFFLISSIILFVIWCATVFGFDRVTYCTFQPGQVVLHNLVGGGARAFDTRGMVVYKLRDDPFRHWIFGIGSGDLHIATAGAEELTLDVSNVCFIDRKLDQIQHLVSLSPDAMNET